MTFEDLYLAMVLTAFTVFFVTISTVWILNRLPPKKPSAKIEAFPARRPAPEPARKAA